MKRHTLTFLNGEVGEVFFDRPGLSQCNVCGYRFDAPPPWWPNKDGEAVPLQDVCGSCETHWGVDDFVGPSSPPNAVADLWMNLRLDYLDKHDWPDELVKRIEDNLHITRAELEAARDAGDNAG